MSAAASVQGRTSRPGHPLAYLGRIDEYRQLCRDVIDDMGDVGKLSDLEVPYAERVAKMCLFSPYALDMPTQAKASELGDFALTVIEEAIAQGDHPGLLPFVQLTKGIADYRRDDLRSAVKRLQASIEGMGETRFWWETVH